MEITANIHEPITAGEFRAFTKGFGEGPIQGPAHVAWLLESAAVDGGWREGEVIGSETDLIARFSVSRDVVRGAIRIVEARGSMRMHRGRYGGLHLQVPGVESAAVALAIYLRSQGYMAPDFARAAAVIVPLLPASPTGEAIRAMIERAGAILSDGTSPAAGSGSRAESFAMSIIERAGAPLPAEGVRIGAEEQLCSEFGLTHRTFRQALNILDDLDILGVNRGRGGGYFLKPASPISVIRRIFVLLASRQATIADVHAMLSALANARLRILFDPLHQLTPDQRRQWADDVLEAIGSLSEPYRWVRLQHAIRDLASDRLITTLFSALISHAARTGAPHASYEPAADALRVSEHGVIEAIREGRLADAERYLEESQALLASLWSKRAGWSSQEPQGQV